MGRSKSRWLSLLLLAYFLHTANTETNNEGCEECSLTRHERFPVYQCKGCCFSRAYPTPLKARRTMVVPKIITSEASCCVAKQVHETMWKGLENHTECHCSECRYHKH